ncbi:type II secretion system F family protein [Phycicoccus duodecadis]|uniref:Tight adherence protein B n=1 Tax=Phycicoccus duodecadis TaxID=173053 RepID=A0A2N3YJZ1_9MICO|nr:type II secretion system F family protein [Phycicoccus duodecadis]PKW27166.1 tight adherence protein B [Phycicoccus duodecadis]
MTVRPPSRLRRLAVLGAVLSAAAATVFAPAASAADTVPGTLSDLRVTADTVSSTVVLRAGDKVLQVDPASVVATIGGKDAKATVAAAASQARSTMLVIDTSGSMGASGMATVRTAVKQFLAVVPKDVKVGMVSFASTSGVDVSPTTDRARISQAVGGLRSQGETALYAAVQQAVAALGTEGERSIVLLSDGGDTVAGLKGGAAGDKAQRQAALNALAKAKVRAEVIAFKSPESNGTTLKQFASVGGGSVANAANSASVGAAFAAAGRVLDSQVVLTLKRPTGVLGDARIVVTGTASGQPFAISTPVDLGDTAPVEVEASVDTRPLVEAGPPPASALTAISPALLYPAIGVVFLGVFAIGVALVNPSFQTKKSARIEAIEGYGFGRAPTAHKQNVNTAAIGQQLVSMGDQIMEGRDSTTKTMALLDRADLPWRAGEWLVLRFLAVVVAIAVGYVALAALPLVGALIGLVLGLVLPPVALKFIAKRRSSKFETVLPDVLMLVATSLASGFSLLQALDAVAKDAPEPAAKEFSRALAESRIGADVSDALDHMAQRMDSPNMRWTTMAIRIQREVGGNLGETLRTTAATLREREMLRRQVKALSAEGRLSAYILIGLPIGIFLYSTVVNYDYVSLLWTTFYGIIMSIGGIISMVIGIFWMRNVVKIEV